MQKSRFEIILWWEFRRILYNLMLIAAIYGTLALLGIDLTTVEMATGEYFIFIILVSYGMLCNVVYTFGWITELLRK